MKVNCAQCFPGVFVLGLLAALLLPVSARGGPIGFDHSLLDSVLARYVDAQGLVDYGALKRDPRDLDRYCGMLAEVSPENAPARFPTGADSLAYWINAYNAFVLKGVVDAYPVDSVTKIRLFHGFFKRTKFVAGGRKLTLDDIEHGIIRKRFQEPRIHAAVNCGAVSCPRLQGEAFRAADLEAQLDRAVRAFLRSPQHVVIDVPGRVVRLSRIFDWYGDDFTSWYADRFGAPDPSVLDYIAQYRPPAEQAFLASDPKIRFLDYDWSLNDQAGSK
jgi:hypothetical protein